MFLERVCKSNDYNFYSYIFRFPDFFKNYIYCRVKKCVYLKALFVNYANRLGYRELIEISSLYSIIIIMQQFHQ